MTEANNTTAVFRSKSVAAGKNAAIAFGFEADVRNPAPRLAIGAFIAVLSLCLERGVPTDSNCAKESAA